MAFFDQTRSTLLSFSSYVQWVPNSDVVVGQNRNNLCVWYSIATPDKVTIYQIKGDVEEIERNGGKTEVIVDEGMHTASYQLDEALIAAVEYTGDDDPDVRKAQRLREERKELRKSQFGVKEEVESDESMGGPGGRRTEGRAGMARHRDSVGRPTISSTRSSTSALAAPALPR